VKHLRIGYGVCIAVVLTVGLAAGAVIWRLSSGPGVGYVQKLLDGANLRGETPKEVVRFLDSDRRLSHAPYAVELINGKEYGVIRANFMNARVDFRNVWPYRVDIVMVFYFSSKGGLDHYDVSERVTSMRIPP
jgi:hypothetical protein